jgi:hypothetical protein
LLDANKEPLKTGRELCLQKIRQDVPSATERGYVFSSQLIISEDQFNEL